MNFLLFHKIRLAFYLFSNFFQLTNVVLKSLNNIGPLKDIFFVKDFELILLIKIKFIFIEKTFVRNIKIFYIN